MVSCTPGWPGTYDVAEDDLNLILVSTSQVLGLHVCVSPHLVYVVWEIEPRASHKLGKHSIKRATSPAP